MKYWACGNYSDGQFWCEEVPEGHPNAMTSRELAKEAWQARLTLAICHQRKRIRAEEDLLDLLQTHQENGLQSPVFWTPNNLYCQPYPVKPFWYMECPSWSFFCHTKMTRSRLSALRYYFEQGVAWLRYMLF